MIGSLDPHATAYVQEVRAAVVAALGDDLVGFYLFGSSVSGHFLTGQSDADVIVVARDWLAPGTVRDLLDRVRAVVRPRSVKGLDLWVVPQDSAQVPRPDPPFECWLLTAIGSELIGGEHHPGDARLVLLFQMCRDHGVALAGPPARDTFGPLERSWVVDAMRVDLGLKGAAGWYRVLNACRTLHFLEVGTMCGKLDGAAWLRARTADPWLIDAAVEWRRFGSGPPLPPAAVDAFVGDVLAQLRGVSPRAVPAGVPSAERGPQVALTSTTPVVSCVMVAPDDPELLSLSARRFEQQDWPDRELLVLRAPGGVDPAALPMDRRVRAIDVRAGDLASWREIALGEAQGDLIAAWDPFAWYSNDRLTQQVRELLSTSVPRMVMPNLLAFDPVTGTARRLGEAALLERATLCAHRHAWTADGTRARFGDRADIAVLLEPTVAHTRGEPADAADARALLDGHLEVYTVAVATHFAEVRPEPLVSCLMPTYNRRRFVGRAISAFVEQDYPNRELVILDDGEDPIEDLVPADPSIRYVRLDERGTIGRKRQLLCDLAEGDLLVQWDDDDWYAPSRLRRQLGPLRAGAADITGILQGYLVDLASLRFWRGELPLHEGRLHAVIVAGTLAYTRDAWQRAGGYPDRSIGEEVALLEAVLADQGRVAPIVNDGIYVCVRHAANSWRLRFDAIEGPPGWAAVPIPDFLPPADVDFYRSFGSTT